MTTKLANGLDANNAKIVNLATPTSANDAVNKSYADSLAPSGGVLDGGNASSAYSGAAKIDLGSAT